MRTDDGPARAGRHELDIEVGQDVAMSDAPGTLIASGRAADVYDLGNGTVLRRYRTDHDTGPEGRLMAWLGEQGVPVPRLHDAGGRDLVMDRISGPTMLEDIEAHPGRMVGHARLLAALQRSINALSAPTWLGRRSTVPDGPAVLHLDLHPMNVIMGSDGPIVIDWTNASRGPLGFDAAVSHVLMSTFEADSLRTRIAQQVLVRAFARSSGREAIRRWTPAACDHRLADANVTTGERSAIQRLRTRAE